MRSRPVNPNCGTYTTDGVTSASLLHERPLPPYPIRHQTRRTRSVDRRSSPNGDELVNAVDRERIADRRPIRARIRRFIIALLRLTTDAKLITSTPCVLRPVRRSKDASDRGGLFFYSTGETPERRLRFVFLSITVHPRIIIIRPMGEYRVIECPCRVIVASDNVPISTSVS